MPENLEKALARDAERIAADHARTRTESPTDKPSTTVTDEPQPTPNRDQGRPKWATKR
ncbi:hypothetical protein [Streptomyces sp. NPDC001978]|uniref:hypothetical protein n=1 Tax=Streptomyces sp. NPDC001978 TaxID=3364627 RepID=UPI0036B80893